MQGSGKVGIGPVEGSWDTDGGSKIGAKNWKPSDLKEGTKAKVGAKGTVKVCKGFKWSG
jgi:hypothetical protein